MSMGSFRKHGKVVMLSMLAHLRAFSKASSCLIIPSPKLCLRPP